MQPPYQVPDSVNEQCSYRRILQFKPAWTLHCLARMNMMNYTSENVSSICTHGIPCPVLVDGNLVLSEYFAVERLTQAQFDVTTQAFVSYLNVEVIQLYKQLERMSDIKVVWSLGGSLPVRMLSQVYRVIQQSYPTVCTE